MADKLRAYSVQASENGCIRFAISNIVARREGANELDVDFSDIQSCVLAPSLDHYAKVGGGVPIKVLVEEHYWTQDCGFCCHRVAGDIPERVWNEDSTQIFCSIECQARSEDLDRALLKQREDNEQQKLSAIAAAKVMFEGGDNFSAYILANRKVQVTFRYPGCKWNVSWFLGDDSVSVSPDDVQVWKESHAVLHQEK
ncbi:hypothetical protein [Yersinia aldovae]|uniref:hypothetical protein n=1 Tax=Yersinia aldovae TaxID=29483 RepID=UPI0011A29022|nr:hypothetical protein [Yersinia aldovae]